MLPEPRHTNTDLEINILGTFLEFPKLLPVFSSRIKSDWFSDDLCARIFDIMVATTQEGRELTFFGLLNQLPEDLGGISRNEFMASLAAQSMPSTTLSDLIHTLRDLWARRKMRDDALQVIEIADDPNVDPFGVATTAVAEFGSIAASQGTQESGTLEQGFDALLYSIDHQDEMRGATTGIRALDEKLNGYKRGSFYVIAGRPGMGKSAFVLSSLRRTALAGHGVAFFSLEMSRQEIAARIASDALYDRFSNPIAPNYSRILNGKLSNGQANEILAARDSVMGMPFFWDSSPSLSMAEIGGHAREIKAQFEAAGRDLEVLCIDHLGLVKPTGHYRGNKVAEASEISGAARALAKELDCCVVMLSQLSRQVESRDDKRPTMSDLRWSGEIEQDAHVVAFLYREYYYLQQKQDVAPEDLNDALNSLEFLIRKNRNGENGDVQLFCSIQHNAVRDAS
ncbi:replicative DNA helicase [Maritalea mobilis]|uniref:DNA 5'-3' helicase n=1 Tax=Maritalea mobilis TaxID=483324 RepID=A0A4R6VN26_9HYPH|nr:DnaB-like helicase C-terminal domain-containing protein [Maritalea mobilis]TDQ63592.1 replicative DNA helicase [Maritalea mobilis]